MPDAPRPDDAPPPVEAPSGPADGPDAGAGAVPGEPTEPVTGAPAAPADVPAAAPDEAELARVATPATVRRAPRYGAFLVTGALVGMVAGLVVAFATAAGSGVAGEDGGVLPFLGGQNGVRWVLALGLGVVGAFVGGALAVLADRRSARRRTPAPGTDRT